MIHDAIAYGLQQVTVPAGRQLWLNADTCPAEVDVYTPWKDLTRHHEARGCRVFSSLDDIHDRYDVVIVFCPKQQEEAVGLLAFALLRSQGVVVIAGANNAGGARLRGMMAAYGIHAWHGSKHRCSIVITHEALRVNRDLLMRDVEALQLRQLMMENENWWTVPGIFGWNKVDKGSQLLMQHVPYNLSGRGADFGCGYGYLARKLLEHCPHIESIDAFDADQRAVTCCARNTEQKLTTYWEDLRTFKNLRAYDAIIMNPPFHDGKQEDRALGEAFIQNAWQSLAPNGRLFLVANRHLAYEKIVPELNVVTQAEGYKVMIGVKQ